MEKKRDPFFLSNKKEQRQERKPDLKSKKKDQEFSNGDASKAAKKFDQARPALKINEEKEKKPFDKKTYRLKKYSKKYKLEQWEDQRKKRLLHAYYKDVQNDPTTGSYKPVSFDDDVTDSNQEVGRFVRHPDLIEKAEEEKLMQSNTIQAKNKKDPYSKAKEQFNKIKQDKQLKAQEIERVKEEKQKKLQEYKKKKQERFKKLSKKNKKGQPVMTGRLELLLEKIQKG